MTSARELVDCSCRSKVVFFLEEKIKNAEDLNLINEILLLPEVQKVKEELDYEFEQEILAFKKKIKKENNAKKIYTVSKDENEWKEFVEYAKENIEFKSFSIIEKENHLEVRFVYLSSFPRNIAWGCSAIYANISSIERISEMSKVRTR